jgi:hypothetical protein
MYKSSTFTQQKSFVLISKNVFSKPKHACQLQFYHISDLEIKYHPADWQKRQGDEVNYKSTLHGRTMILIFNTLLSLPKFMIRE